MQLDWRGGSGGWWDGGFVCVYQAEFAEITFRNGFSKLNNEQTMLSFEELDCILFFRFIFIASDLGLPYFSLPHFNQKKKSRNYISKKN